MNRIVVASANAGKLKELSRLLTRPDLEVVPQSELGVSDAVEDGKSFIENALIKARHAASHTGLPSIADDSGLMVDALDGAPGIFSARYSGVHGDYAANNATLMAALQGVAAEARQATFVCAAVYLRHADDPLPVISVGQWHGRILDAPRGNGGFGYDPLFLVPTHDCSVAELDANIKNTISHRARAMTALKHLINLSVIDGG
jgi:XTP/dITP diphosphohydrolase